MGSVAHHTTRENTMSEISRTEYLKEIRSLAEEAARYARDGEFGTGEQAREGLSEWIWQTIDGHQWVIFAAYNFSVLDASDNDGAYVENYGSGGLVGDGVLNTVVLAYAAMEADLNEALRDLDDFDANDPNPDAPSC